MPSFSTQTYELDSGSFAAIRVTEDVTEVGGNTAAAVGDDGVTLPFFVKISKTNREFGVRPRLVVIQKSQEATIGDGDDAETVNIKTNATIPIFQKAVFDGATFALGADVTYKGEEWKVVSRKPEDY